MTDLARVDLVLKFALAAARRQDWGHRELGAIHLLKFVYLADLAHADRHQGQIFTEGPWRFYHFGPWCEAVFERINPVVAELGATEHRYPSKLADDVVRWVIEDAENADRLFDETERVLPLEIIQRVGQAVHTFGTDTTELLHHVYSTRPMLRAAPGEALDFSLAPEDSSPEPAWVTEPVAIATSVSKKERSAALEALRERVRLRLAARTSARAIVPPDPPPRYDAVYSDGIHSLDELAGDPPELHQGTLYFSDEVWKSRGRGDPEIS